MRCRAATLTATVEEPGFPLSMADGGGQKLKEGEDGRVQDAVPPPALYKGMGWGLGCPAQPIKTRKAQGTGTNPLPRPAMTRFPASTVRHPKRMRTTWQACGTEATGEETSPHPVIVGSGRLENHASAPFSKWVAPPCLPPFMGKAQIAPFTMT